MIFDTKFLSDHSLGSSFTILGILVILRFQDICRYRVLTSLESCQILVKLENLLFSNIIFK